MIRLLMLMLMLLVPSLCFADCPWTVRGQVKDKEGALRKCGPPDFTTVLDSYQSGPYIETKELWVYENRDGSETHITFRGDKRIDFDQKR